MTTGGNRERRWFGAATAALVAVALAFCAALVSCRGRRGQIPIRLRDGQRNSVHINNALAKFIIEKGYGHPVEIVTQNSYEMQKSMEKGSLDVILEARRQDWLNWYNEQVKAGTILSLGVLYEGGAQFYVIPKWVAEQYNIATVLDMREHWKIFADPDDPSKGVFYNGMIGWGSSEINKVKLEAYRLNKYYNVVYPASAEALQAALERAQSHKRPIFAYCWAPNALLGAYEWHILKEPDYSEEVWEEIAAAVEDETRRPVDQACAYKTIPIEKIIHRGLLKKAPEVVEMLKKMRVGLNPMNDVLAWTHQNNIWNWDMSALYYLRTYPERWKSWVTPEALAAIEAALKQAPGHRSSSETDVDDSE